MCWKGILHLANTIFFKEREAWANLWCQRVKATEALLEIVVKAPQELSTWVLGLEKDGKLISKS